VKRRTEGSSETQVLCLAMAILAIILSAASITLHVVGAGISVMIAVSSFSTAAAALVSLFVLLVAWANLRTSQGMLEEMRKQREAAERPNISVVTTPEPRRPGVLNLRVANTGRGPAYNVKVRFDPDIPWGESTLNTAGILSSIPVLGGGEKVEIFLAAGGQLRAEGYPTESIAHVTYFQVNVEVKPREPLTASFHVLLSAWLGHMQIRLKDMHELVEEVEDLKHALLIALEESQRNTQHESESN